MIDTKTAPYAALTLRVALGALFLAHAGLKLFVYTPAGAAGFFSALGLPGWLAIVTIAAEIAAGLALILGFHARIAAVAAAPILIGSIFFVHGGNGWLFSNEGGGWEFPAFWTAALAVQALLGDGAHALRRT